jgi:hypothetical protein
MRPGGCVPRTHLGHAVAVGSHAGVGHLGHLGRTRGLSPRSRLVLGLGGGTAAVLLAVLAAALLAVALLLRGLLLAGSGGGGGGRLLLLLLLRGVVAGGIVLLGSGLGGLLRRLLLRGLLSSGGHGVRSGLGVGAVGAVALLLGVSVLLGSLGTLPVRTPVLGFASLALQTTRGSVIRKGCKAGGHVDRLGRGCAGTAQGPAASSTHLLPLLVPGLDRLERVCTQMEAEE